MLDGLISKNGVVAIQPELPVLEGSFGVVFVVGFLNILQFASSCELNMYLFGYIIVSICVLCGSKDFATADDVVNSFGIQSAFSACVGFYARVFHYMP